MFVFVTVFSGFALAASCICLVRGLTGLAPAFDRETVNSLGTIVAYLVFCASGPLLVVRAFDKAGERRRIPSPGASVVATTLCVTWAGSLGIVAVETARLIL